MVNKPLKKGLFWTIGFLRSGYRGLEGHLEAIWGPVWDGSWRVNLEVNSGQFWTLSGPYLQKPHKTVIFSLIWP